MPTSANFFYYKQMKYELKTNETRAIDFVKSAFNMQQQSSHPLFLFLALGLCQQQRR